MSLLPGERAVAAGGRPGRALVVQAGILAVAAIFYRPVFLANFGVVEPGKVYRSAQLDEGLERSVRRLGVASVLNLRGGSERDGWYRHEVEASRRLGVDFYDLPLSSTRRPTRRELLVLLDVLGRCRYPLLIHCKSGADRTGMVSGLYLMARGGAPPERALDEFTVLHAHIPLFGPERLHEPFREYAAWLRAHGLSHTPGRLREWVARDYRAEDSAAGVPRLRTGPRPRIAEAAGDTRWR